MKRSLFSLICVSFLLATPLLAQKDDIEARAMRDELQRSMKQLHLESADAPQPPYFISYKVTDTERALAQASFGSVISSSENRSRTLTVTVRVGSYAQDNTNFSGNNTGLAALLAFAASSNVLPVDDSYDELRRKIWLATDAAYKKAVEDLSAKKAARQNRNGGDSVPDFSKQPPRQESETLPPVHQDLAAAEHLVRVTSTLFRKIPGVESSSAQFEITNTAEHFVDSEGTSYLREIPNVYFHATATLQNGTGEVFNDSYTVNERSLSAFPSETALVHEVGLVCDRLTARRRAKVAKRYNGPVLVQGEAVAELFAHDFANLLSTHRSGSASTSNLLAALLGVSTGSNASLLDKVGSRVLPESLTVTNNPLLTQMDGHPLLGNYKFDEEGVPAQETVLVKDGILKTLLTSRTPARGMQTSTGSQRENGVLPGNLIVEASKTATADELRAQMMELVKTRGLEYGVIVRRLANRAATEAIRVYPDGHEESLRDARVAEITAGTFKDILGVSKERTYFTDRSGSDLTTYAVPDMLFEDMTVEHVQNNGPKLPIVPSPLDAK